MKTIETYAMHNSRPGIDYQYERKTDARTGRQYVLRTARNGSKYVLACREDGALPILHITGGNSKTGTDHVLTYSHGIEQSCSHSCECYSGKVCYGMHGNYERYPVNQLYLADTLLYIRENGYEATTAAIIEKIKKTHCKYFRWFAVGDILNIEFIEMMVNVGKACPDVKFWGYTKKYMLVNHYIENRMHGDAETFHALTGLIFSHWRNQDGSFFEMLNPYKMPLSEFIPLGNESDAAQADHICPCSNPDVFENCCNCSNPCYDLQLGQSMALLEHSTSRTAARDKSIKQAHKAIQDAEKKAGNKPAKKTAKTTAKKAGAKPAKTARKRRESRAAAAAV